MRRRWLLVFLLACLAPTEIELDITTNVDCASVKGTRIVIGASGVDAALVSIETSECTPGNIGTLSVVPGGMNDPLVSIEVAESVGIAVDACVPPYTFDASFGTGCIVARRSLRYDPHTPLTLPIALNSDCLNVPCDSNDTCVNGACVEAGVVCANEVCGVVDASPVDAGSCGPVVGPSLVSTLSVGPVQPHLAITTSGLAVGFETAAEDSARIYEAILLNAAGDGGTPKKVTGLQADFGAGALGSDGTHYAVGLMNAATSMYGYEIAIDTSISSASSVLQGITALSGFGMVWDGAMYWFLASSNSGLELAGFTPGGSTGELNLDPAQSTSPVLSGSAGSYFVAYQNSQGLCALLTCPGLSLSMSCPSVTYASCSTVRAAAQNGVTLIATVGSTNPVLQVFLESDPTQTATLGPADSQAVFVLPASSGFQVIWASAGKLMTAAVSPTLVVSGLTTIATGLGTPPLFDAIADPTGYAVAFYGTLPTSGLYVLEGCD